MIPTSESATNDLSEKLNMSSINTAVRRMHGASSASRTMCPVEGFPCKGPKPISLASTIPRPINASKARPRAYRRADLTCNPIESMSPTKPYQETPTSAGISASGSAASTAGAAEDNNTLWLLPIVPCMCILSSSIELVYLGMVLLYVSLCYKHEQSLRRLKKQAMEDMDAISEADNATIKQLQQDVEIALEQRDTQLVLIGRETQAVQEHVSELHARNEQLQGPSCVQSTTLTSEAMEAFREHVETNLTETEDLRIKQAHYVQMRNAFLQQRNYPQSHMSRELVQDFHIFFAQLQKSSIDALKSQVFILRDIQKDAVESLMSQLSESKSKAFELSDSNKCILASHSLLQAKLDQMSNQCTKPQDESEETLRSRDEIEAELNAAHQVSLAELQGELSAAHRKALHKLHDELDGAYDRAIRAERKYRHLENVAKRRAKCFVRMIESLKLAEAEHVSQHQADAERIEDMRAELFALTEENAELRANNEWDEIEEGEADGVSMESMEHPLTDVGDPGSTEKVSWAELDLPKLDDYERIHLVW